LNRNISTTVRLPGNGARCRRWPNKRSYASPYTSLTILCNKTAKVVFKKLAQFIFVVKAAALNKQISSTEAGFYIYDRPMTEINVIASFCALNLLIKFGRLLF